MISRTQLRLRVSYGAPVRAARRVLRVLPLARAGQSVLSESWRASPDADFALEKRDQWGNRRLMIYHRALPDCFDFELEIETQTCGAPVPLLAGEKLGAWKLPSRAVDWNGDLLELGRQSRALAAEERARQFCQLCHQNMRYDARAQARPQRASAMWGFGAGSCADFTHVFLALCRASGLAARYVVGYNPAEGQLHAWAEVLIEKSWHPFDPTHGRAPSPGCVAVAVGRDFYDVPPHVGQFHGADATHAQLSLLCRTQTRP